MHDQEIEDKKGGIDPFWVFCIVRDIAVLVVCSWSSVFTAIFICKNVLRSHANFFWIYFALLFVLMIAGYTCSACLSRKNRWLHLVCVAIGVWVVDAFGCFTITGLDISFCRYLAIRLLFIVIPMLIGGTLSFVFKKGNIEPAA